MSPNEKQFARLSKATSKLNAEADEFTAQIVELEKRLADLGVAVPRWLEGRQLGCETNLSPSKRKGYALRGETYYVLGYAKIGASNWRVAVKPARKVVDEWQGAGIGEDDTVVVWEDTGDAVPLVQAPRAIRAEAAPLIDELLDALAETTEKLAEKVSEGRKALQLK